MSNGMDIGELRRILAFQEIQSSERGLEENQKIYERIFGHYLGSVGSVKEHYGRLLDIIQGEGYVLQTKLNDREEN